MTLLTKERKDIQFSSTALAAIHRMAERGRSREQEIISLTPPCPDGSGEIGKYNQAASTYFGVVVYSTPSKKYFRYPGKVIPSEYIPERLR